MPGATSNVATVMAVTLPGNAQHTGQPVPSVIRKITGEGMSLGQRRHTQQQLKQEKRYVPAEEEEAWRPTPQELWTMAKDCQRHHG